MTTKNRLGHKLYWQVSVGCNVEETKRTAKNINEHSCIISQWHVIQPFRLPIMMYAEVCNYFTSPDVLEDILMLYLDSV